MPRPKLIVSNHIPYHVRSRNNNTEWFSLPLNEVWQIFCQTLNKTIKTYNISVQAFVLMSNHFHLILITPEGNLGRAMQYFLRESSKKIGLKSGRINHIFGSQYQRSLLTNSEYFINAYKYVYRNPVAAGLCQRVEDYPFSTLPSQLGITFPPVPLILEPKELFRLLPPQEEMLEWLNTGFQITQAELVRKGLKRQRFGWSSDGRYYKWRKSMSPPFIKSITYL